MKYMHRLMVTSNAYQMASDAGPEFTQSRAIDPNNDHYWRFPLNRLEAEVIWDAIHLAADNLDLSIGGPSFTPGDASTPQRRGVYITRGYSPSRNVTPDFLQAFDVDDGREPCPVRTQTVTAPQSLFLMNSPEVEQASSQFADRLRKLAEGELGKAVALAYRLTLHVPPQIRRHVWQWSISRGISNASNTLPGFSSTWTNLSMSADLHPQSMSTGHLSRRHFFHRAGGGFLGAALGGIWAEGGEIKDALLGPHFKPRAKSVIFLFMCGGVSHIDTFDPKGNRHAGQFIDAIGFGDNQAQMQRPVIPCHRTFTRYGQSGIPVSDWFPHIGGVIDEIAVVRSMWCHEGNHFPAVIETYGPPWQGF